MTAPRDDWDRDERDALAGLEGQLTALRRRHAATPPLDLLRAANAGVLPDDVQGRVARHLSGSAWSRALVAAADHDEEVLSPEDRTRLFARITTDIARDRKTSSWTWLRPAFLAPAAIALAAIASLVVMTRNMPSAARPADSIVAVAQPTPAPFLLAFEKPDVRLSVAALTWRGAAEDNRLLADLKPALDAYRRADYAAAVREFTTLEPRYPGAVEIPFYKGVSSLFVDDLPGAIAALTAAERIGDATFADDISWYRAVAEQRAGNLTGARERLDALCGGNGAGAARACAALKQLPTSSERR